MNKREVARAFRMAKQPLRTADLEFEKQRFICYALNRAVANPNAAQKVVLDRLGYYTLSAWLVRNGHATEAEIQSKAGQQKLQTTRHAWLDSLIEEFEK